MAGPFPLDRRLAIQGYATGAGCDLASLAAGARFAPALCAIGAAAGTVLQSPLLLGAMMVLAFAGAATSRHPFDHLWNAALRKPVGRSPLPPNGAPRRFACGLGTAWLAATIVAFLAGWEVAAFVLGLSMTAVAALVATTHVCLPSIVYALLFRHGEGLPFGRAGAAP